MHNISWFKTDIFNEHARYTLDAIGLSASIYTASPSWKPYEHCIWRGMVDCQIVAHLSLHTLNHYPDSKVHGANMEHIWGRQHPGGLHVGPMNFVILVISS